MIHTWRWVLYQFLSANDRERSVDRKGKERKSLYTDRNENGRPLHRQRKEKQKGP